MTTIALENPILAHLEHKNYLVLHNLEKFTKYFPNIRELAIASNLKIEIEREFNTNI